MLVMTWREPIARLHDLPEPARIEIDATATSVGLDSPVVVQTHGLRGAATRELASRAVLLELEEQLEAHYGDHLTPDLRAKAMLI